MNMMCTQMKKLILKTDFLGGMKKMKETNIGEFLEEDYVHSW